MNNQEKKRHQQKQPSVPKCLRCILRMKTKMKMPVRIGGIQVFFANWGDRAKEF
jgi:hypothetical protein